jgi:two-component system NtrC family sensor kinase
MQGNDKRTDGSHTKLSTFEEHAVVYAAVIDSALDSVVVVDEEGLVVTINPAAEETFGYSRAEAIGREIGSLIVPEHMRSAHSSGMARYKATGDPHVLGRRVEMDARCKDGRIIPVELAITEVNLPSGRLFTANLRDLSAARAAAAEIERQRDALYQGEKLSAIGSLLAGIAHELNNPLSIVLGQASILREEIEADVRRHLSAERAAKIETAAQRCARVIRSFLAIARQRKAEKKPISIVPLIDASVELVLYGLKSSGIQVERDYAAALPDAFADPDQVQNILVNLLVNAMQALEQREGPRRIRISTRGNERTLTIGVADNGPGIPAAIAQRIFDPFFTTKPEGMGTGIGLSISRGLAEAQGGALTLRDTSEGAAFELTLPLAATADDGASADAAAEGADILDDGQNRPRAILIDDEIEIAMLMAEFLRGGGYSCEVAAGGRAAQAIIDAHAGRFDVLVCDIRMPDVDGQALFRWLGAHHPSLVERTIFVTGDSLGPAAGRFLAESRRPVLEKPFTADELTRQVAALVAEQTAKQSRNV